MMPSRRGWSIQTIRKFWRSSTWWPFTRIVKSIPSSPENYGRRKDGRGEIAPEAKIAAT
jgi:hypothetical protein